MYVSRLTIRGVEGARSNFKAGDDAWLDVEITANRRMERLSLAVSLRDARNIDVFYASMLRLGLPPFTLDAGETRTFTVHLKLHLAGGAFLVGTVVYSYGSEVHASADAESDAGPFRYHDERFPLGTLLIDSPIDVGGLANLYPEITMGQSLNLTNLPDCSGDPTLEEEVRSVPWGRTALLMDTMGDMPPDGDGLVMNARSKR